MASKSTAPSLRTSSAIRKKEEEEAAAALAIAARAAELNAAISQAAQQAAEAAYEATARILRREAQADRERFERQIAELNRVQVDFIVVGSAPAPAPSPSPEPGYSSRNSFASQSDVAEIASSQLPPPAQSPPAKTPPPAPPGRPSPAKPRPSPQDERIASLELALRLARGEVENPSALSIAGHSPGYSGARDAAGAAGPATSTLGPICGLVHTNRVYATTRVII